MNFQYTVISMLCMAGITYLIRFLPFLIFKKPIKNKFVKSFLYYVPYSVLSAMTFPAVFYSTNNLPAAVVATAVAVILAFFGRGLVLVAASSVASALVVILSMKLF